MNKKISDLSSATTPSGPEFLEILQGGVNKKVTWATLLTLVGGAQVDGETPSGSVNDVNTVFTLAFTPIVGSVKVYQNGIRLKVTTDYTISGTTITFVTPPSGGPPADIILADYRR